nr:MCE family protein [Saprospiraceae bacterium]
MIIRNEVKIGIFSIVIILVSIWGYQFLKGKNILASSNIFYAKYETVEQLPQNAEILLRGKRVGTVSDIFFSSEMEYIVIELDIDKNIPVPKDAKVHIVSMGIASQKAVELIFDKACEGNNCAKSGDYLIGLRKGFIESMVDQEELQEYMLIIREGLSGIIDTLSNRFTEGEEGNEFFKTFERLGNTVANLEKITTRIDRQLALSGDGISQVVKNTQNITAKLDSQMDSLLQTLSNLNQITGDLAQQNLGDRLSGTFDKADEGLVKLSGSMEKLNQLLLSISEGDGTLSKLINEPDIAQNLQTSLNNLNLLIEDIRLNPGRYTHVKVSLFGKGNRQEYVAPVEASAEEQ